MAGPPVADGQSGRTLHALTLYADLECPFCRSYFPVLKRWVAGNADVSLYSSPPVGSAWAGRVRGSAPGECAGQASGLLPPLLANRRVGICPRAATVRLAGDCATRPYATHRAVHREASSPTRGDSAPKLRKPQAGSVTATPSLRLHDRETGKAILLRGPIGAMPCCRPWGRSRPYDPAATPSGIPADVVGDVPR